MTNYNIVAYFSPNMKRELLAGRMPPWHADPAYGAFANDFSLKPDEAAKLVQEMASDFPDDVAGRLREQAARKTEQAGEIRRILAQLEPFQTESAG